MGFFVHDSLSIPDLATDSPSFASKGKQVPGYYRHTDLIRFLMILCVIALPQACLSKKMPPANCSADDSNRAIPPEVLEQQKIFAETNPEIVSQHGSLTMVVRMATANDLPADMSKTGLLFSAEGGASMALGFALPSIYSSALVVGGIFLVPAGTYFYLHDKKVWEVISGTLSHAGLTGAISKAMQERVDALFSGTNPPELTIELTIKAFGLVKSKTGVQHCLVMSADCIISRNGRQIGRSLLKITESDRSDDAPPPQCARIESFAAHGARLLDDHLYESSHVIAAMAIERLLKVEGQ